MTKPSQSDRTRSFFDDAAKGWSSRYDRDVAMSSRRSTFADALESRFSALADILDFGCGSGDIARYLAERGHRLTACDISRPMIEQARRRDPNQKIKWIALASCEESLPFDNLSFDAVVTSSVLEYVDTVDTTLAKLAATLRPDGWLFATVPDLRSPLRRRELWLRRAAMMPMLSTLLANSRWREGAQYQRISINRWPIQKWQSLLSSAGFSVEPAADCTGPLVLLSARKLSNT